MAGIDDGKRRPADEEKRLDSGIVDRPARRMPRRACSLANLLGLVGLIVLTGIFVVPHWHKTSRLITKLSRLLPGQCASSRITLESWQAPRREENCSTVQSGYQCFADLSHRWGQYSPFFSLASESSVPEDVPEGCQIIFVQLLSRHGARYPTHSKSRKYAALVKHIQANVTAFEGKYAFLHTYNYSLGSDDLTTFGEDQMLASGIKFYGRYEELGAQVVPFIRASGSDRVIASGVKFIEGFQQSKEQDQNANHQQPIPKIDVIISEDSSSNNSLDHGACRRFEKNKHKNHAEDTFKATFVPAIRHRLESDLPGIHLHNNDVVYLMDICAFDTMARTPDATEASPFCDLFMDEEWTQYNYLRSLSKYYDYGAGNPLGPTQGIGFANELIARLTHHPVHDNTSTNHTLDAPGSPSFPLNATLYADFTHDNGMIPIFFALGLYNGTAPLSPTHVESVEDADGYSAAWTVPFGARAYIEMMQCSSSDPDTDPDLDSEPLVRVLVNDRVVPLHGCPVDRFGRCRRRDFVEGLSFARSGGNWDRCSA